MHFSRRCGSFLLVTLTLSCLAGCADYSALQFRQDHRLTFTAPESRELVETPLKVSWTIEDFQVVKPGSGEPSENAGYFAVFVDQAPVEPRATLDEVAEDDPDCVKDPKCPDRTYLADRGVYTTTDSELTLELIPALGSKEDVQLHEVTVVLLDSSGRRIGEVAWYQQFKMKNRATYE